MFIGGYILLRHSKNLLNTQPVRVIIEKKQHAIPCPVQALQKFMSLRGTLPGPLFSSPAAERVSRQTFSRHMDLVLCRAGFKAGQFKGHSFRIGRASDCSAQGVPDAQVRLLGRWHSDAFKTYIRPVTLN